MVVQGATRPGFAGLGQTLAVALLTPWTAIGDLKVIGAGLPRSGTSSLTEALKVLGYQHVMHHHCGMHSHCLRAACEWMHNGTEQPILEEVRHQRWEVVSDEPMCHMYKELAAGFPHAKVILTVRDSAEDWYRSFSRMQELYWRGRIEARGIPTASFGFNDLSFWDSCDQYSHVLHNCPIFSENQTEEIRQGCLDGYEGHVEHVKRDIPPERLLVFNVKEGWAPLCRFLGRPVPPVPFPFENHFLEFLAVSNAIRAQSESYWQKLKQCHPRPLPGSK